MINAYAASEPKGRLEPFAYDPGELKPQEVEIDVHSCGIGHHGGFAEPNVPAG